MKAAPLALFVSLLASSAPLFAAQPVVPGTGTKITKVGDDFEDAAWSYKYNLPKSSEENDKQIRQPAGSATNGRWFEGAMRGQPDVIKRVPTPEGGLAGSEGSLLLQSRQTGVPGYYSGIEQQDDLIVDVVSRIKGHVPVAWSPNVVVRVYVPPFDQWERRNGSSFGFRAACQAFTTKSFEKGRKPRNVGMHLETYWPGMFIQLMRGNGKTTQDYGLILVRGAQNGGDFAGPKITEPGWWTLGLSFTPDGQVHYYAHAGVEDLTEKDRISSQFPYGFRCEQFDTFFFNIVSGDNGSWSTPWIIDDPTLYYTKR